MSRFVYNRVRCALDPDQVDEKFKAIGNRLQTPKAYKSVEMEWQFAFFDGNALRDITNLVKVQLMAKTLNSPSSAPVLLSPEIITFNPSLTLAEWNAGTGHHVAIKFTSAQMNIAAATYDITVFGTTLDAAAENDIFGVSTLLVLDRGLDNTIAPAPGGSTAATLEDLTGVAAQRVKLGRNPNGKFFTLVNQDGTWGITFRVGPNGEPIFEPIPNP